MAIQGTLKSLALPELLSLLHQLRKTGILHVVWKDDERGFLFSGGDLVCATAKHEARRLGSFLARLGFANLRELEALARRPGIPGEDRLFGQQLVEAGRLTVRQLRDAVRTQVTEILREVLAWENGAFHFDDHPLPFTVDPGTLVSTQSVVFEVARLADENAYARTLFSDGHAILAREADPETSRPRALDPQELELLELVDGCRTVEQIFFESQRSVGKTAALLRGLLEKGVVRRSGVKVQPSRRTVPDLRFLPCSPEICTQLLSALERAPDQERLGELVGRDPMLAVKLLRAVTLRNVELPPADLSLVKLIDALGPFHVRAELLPEALRGLFFYDEDRYWQLLWRHSWLCASLAREAAIRCGYPFPEQAYLAGLVHNLGAFILYNHDPEKYSGAGARSAAEGLDLEELEEDLFGVAHTRVGGIYAEKWKFPRVLSLAIRHHHRAEAVFSSPLLHILGVAEGVLAEGGVSVGHHAQGAAQYRRALERLELERSEAQKLLVLLGREVRERSLPGREAAVPVP